MNQRTLWMITLVSFGALGAGCRAPVPTVRNMFAPAGATRIAPPATGSYTTPDPYYTGAGGLAPPRASTQPVTTNAAGAAIPPTPPYAPSTASAAGTTLPDGRYFAPPVMEVGAAPPRVGITRQSTAGTSFQPGNLSGGMIATDLSRREPSTFVPPNRALEIGDLPTSNVAHASAAPHSILVPGQVGTYPRSTVAGNSQWQQRR
ncbi:MAG: hypothetical protein KDB14_05710 [Planctomycetales bacterium]|nr:hypothetical protein [Planctomycetales bacterium]